MWTTAVGWSPSEALRRLSFRSDPGENPTFFSPDGTILASVSKGGTVRLWDVDDGRWLVTLRGPTEPVVSVFFSPDGTILASVSKGGTVRLWDVDDGRELATLRGPAEPVVSVSFSPDGTTLASVSKGGTVRVWDVANRQSKVVRGPTEPVVSVFFSPDGTILASVSKRGTIWLWDVDDGRELAVLHAFAGEVEDQAYTAGAAISALVLPEATGGEGAITYRVSELPAGLSFDDSTRTISGTPEAATDGTVEVTYTAEDSTGAAVTLIFSITVNPPLSFGDLSDLFN